MYLTDLRHFTIRVVAGRRIPTLQKPTTLAQQTRPLCFIALMLVLANALKQLAQGNREDLRTKQPHDEIAGPLVVRR